MLELASLWNSVEIYYVFLCVFMCRYTHLRYSAPGLFVFVKRETTFLPGLKKEEEYRGWDWSNLEWDRRLAFFQLLPTSQRPSRLSQALPALCGRRSWRFRCLGAASAFRAPWRSLVARPLLCFRCPPSSCKTFDKALQPVCASLELYLKSGW